MNLLRDFIAILPALLGLGGAGTSLVFALYYKRWVYLLVLLASVLITVASYLAGFFLIILGSYFPPALVLLPLALVAPVFGWVLLHALHEHEGMI
jgi:hypothetical protein